MPRLKEPPEPWRSFFTEVNARLTEDVQLHFCGGFVATQFYGLARTTSDVDFLGAVPNIGGNLSERKYKVYLDEVTVATPPESYEDRLTPMYPGAWSHLQLCALEVHDLALAKLERNIERDRDDVQQLARAGHLNPEILKERYYSELRPYLLAHEDRHDLTLRLWLEAYW